MKNVASSCMLKPRTTTTPAISQPTEPSAHISLVANNMKHGRRPTPKSGGTKSENYWFKKPIFLNLQKRQKSKFWGFSCFFLSCNL